MVIHDLDIFRALRCPAEAQAPLTVDADAALAFAISRQPFEPVRGPGGQIAQCGGGVQVLQSVLCLLLEGAIATHAPALEKRQGILVLEAPYHGIMLGGRGCDVKRPGSIKVCLAHSP